MKPRSAARLRRTPLSAIQPEAKADEEGPKRRAQVVPSADGGGNDEGAGVGLGGDVGRDAVGFGQREALGAEDFVGVFDGAVGQDRADRRVDVRENALRLAERISADDAVCGRRRGSPATRR